MSRQSRAQPLPAVGMVLPILWLTIRQFAAGKAVRVVALFAATPVILALLFLLSAEGESPTQFVSGVFLEFLAPTVVPLATLVLATGALGNELSDRTIAYIALKPVGRRRIVLEKFGGVIVVTGVALLLGAALTWLVIALGDSSLSTRALLALLLGVIAGIAAYGSLFLLVSLVIPRALVVGIIYILLWESLLARYIPGIKLVSVRHFAQSVYVRVLDDSAVTIDRAMQLGSAVIVLSGLVVLSLVLATVRLRSMNLD